MTTTTTRTRLSADRAARFIERAISARSLDIATQADAQTLLESIDSGTVRGLNSAVETLIGAGFQRGALAVAAASTPRETRSAVDAIRAVAALAGALGVGLGFDAEANETDNETGDADSADSGTETTPASAASFTSSWGA